MRIHGPRFWCCVRAILVLAVLASWVAEARAEDPLRAKELFQQGTTFFDLGQFDKAIDAWQEGYKAKADPGFLYNIGQAYRLAGDAQKAIFFYKGYLRNSPKAHNRGEVEQKITALQRQIADQDLKRPAATPPGARNEPPPPPPSAPAAPAAPVVAVAPPPGSPAAPPPAVDPAPSTPTIETAPPALGAPRDRRLDLGAAMGSDFWSGLRGTAQPSFAFTLSAGYMFGAPARQTRFRLGLVLGYTFLKEPSSTEKFVSFLIEPSLRIRLSDRTALRGGLGIGVLAIGGLEPGSALLAARETVTITGTQSLLEIRPAGGLEIRLTPGLALLAEAGLAGTPKRPHFNAAITRLELLVGLALLI